MPIFLGALASVLIGLSDFLGRYGTRRSNAVTATAGALVGGVIVTAGFVLVVPSAFSPCDALLGAGSGLVVGLALALMYESMAISSAAIGGPVVALGAALFPLLWDIVRGNSPSGLVLAGVVLAMASLLLVTYSPALRGTVKRGVQLAVGGAVLFGIAMTLLGSTSDGSGAWAPFVQRSVALVVMVSLARIRSLPRFPDRDLFPVMLASGAFGAGAVVAFAVGTQMGSLAAVAVSASMFPAVSATLSALFDDDTIRWWQAIGIGGVICGVALMALG